MSPNCLAPSLLLSSKFPAWPLKHLFLPSLSTPLYSLLMSPIFQSIHSIKLKCQPVIMESFPLLSFETPQIQVCCTCRIWFITFCRTYSFIQKKNQTIHSPFAFLILIYGNLKQKYIVCQECQGKFCFSDLRKDNLLFLQTFYANLTTTKLPACISLTFNKIYFFLLVIKLPRDLLSTNVLQSILEG